MSEISSFNPLSLLDVGCGFGRWGFLIREAQDICKERYKKSEWLTRIDAVEVFKDYICPHHEYIYNNIYIMKIQNYLKKMPRYDVIVAGDVIEHLDKSEGEKIIHSLLSKTNKALIVAMPLGDNWTQGEFFGNIDETHRSIWYRKDFIRLKYSYIKVFKPTVNQDYAVVVWTKMPSRISYINRLKRNINDFLININLTK